VPLTFGQLTSAETALWEAFAAGETVDLLAGPERTVRGEVLAWLLRGARQVDPGDAPGVNLAGARITGKLDLSCATVSVPLRLTECHFDEVPVFDEAVLRSLVMLRCHLPGFRGKLMRVEGQLGFSQSTVEGMLLLTRATVTGELALRGTRLVNPGGWALFAGGLTVESAVFGGPYTEGDHAGSLWVRGGLRLVGARLLGGVFFDEVRLSNPGGVVLQGDNMTVFGRMFCGKGFRAEGGIRMPRARIDGELSFEGGVLAGGEVALSLDNAVVGDLNLRTAEPIAGLVDLRHARCAVLRDAPAIWPPQVALDGFVYDAVDAGDAGLSVRERLAWLRREKDGYRPQPYEQLAGLYQRLGADAESRRVLLDKQRAHRRELPLPGRIAGRLLDWTVGYGYRPWRAAVWLALALILGTAVFSAWPPVADGSPRVFDPLVYTVDLLLPISAFGLRDAFAPMGATRWLAYGLTAAGWLLATALIAGVTRVLRRN